MEYPVPLTNSLTIGETRMKRLATHFKVAQRILSCNEFRLRTNFMSFFLKTLQDNHSIETKIMHEYRQKNLWEFYHSSIYINCTEEVIEMNLNFFALICKAGETKKNQIPLVVQCIPAVNLAAG